jgi:hypothetical protein
MALVSLGPLPVDFEALHNEIDVRIARNSWNTVPRPRRLAILATSIVESNPGETVAVSSLIGIAVAMAEQLSEEQKFIVAV